MWITLKRCQKKRPLCEEDIKVEDPGTYLLRVHVGIGGWARLKSGLELVGFGAGQ